MMGRGFFHRPVAFGFCYVLLLVFQVSVAIYIAGVLTTLERRFRIKTSLAGLLLSTSDIASLPSILAVTYASKSWHRPRIVGVAALLTGLGAFFSGLPHFLYPAYRNTPLQPTANQTAFDTSSGESTFVCDASREEETCTVEQVEDSGSRIHEMWALFLGQALMGLAYGPLFPVAVTYIDDQVKGITTPYYIAAILIATASSTIVGFGQGYAFLSTNVNWPAPPDYTKEWFGAWWLGFIVDGAIIVFLAIPFFFFPREMDVEIEEEDIPKERLVAEEGPIARLGVRDFLRTSKRIASNGIFMMLLIATIFELALSASFGFFMPKFFEIRYHTSPSISSILVGIIVMPGALIGNLLSATIVKKMELTPRGCGRLIVGVTVVVLCCIPVVYFLPCPEPNYDGYDKEAGTLNVDTQCNDECMCTTDRFEPVCGADGLVYTNPCLAGCTGRRNEPTDDPMVNITVYTGCKCSAANVSGLSSAEMEEAWTGKCLQTCNNVYYTGVILFLIVVFGSMVQNPLVIFQMRTVGDDKTFALGSSALFSRALGFLPAPLYFGAAIQGSCALDRTECGITGDCHVYGAGRFTLTFLGIYFFLKICGLIFFTLALISQTFRQRFSQDIQFREDVTWGLEGNYNPGFEAFKEARSQTENTRM